MIPSTKPLTSMLAGCQIALLTKMYRQVLEVEKQLRLCSLKDL